MALSEARKRANAKYDAKHFRTLSVRFKIDEAEQIIAHAKTHGETVNAYLVRAAREQMHRDKGAGPEDAQDESNV